MTSLLTALLILLVATSASAQNATDTAGSQAAAPSAGPLSAWTWTVDSNAFFGFNYQHRKFTDFQAWESQNWISAALARPAGRGRIGAQTMVSLEAMTLHDLGSPQVFQTGETFHSAPLIDYQHPHDLLMALGSDYRHPVGRVTLLAEADIVGSPSLGPAPFMHRPSARDNPQAPLSHHYLDSTHITPGVLRGGVGAGSWTAEASWFHGREPDENRLDLDLGALDSVAGRLSWNRGPWSAQVSAAQLTQPEITSPYDAKRATASLAYTSAGVDRGISWMAAFGQNREIHGNLEAYLFEASIRRSAETEFYVRAENVAKDILDAGFHPRGVFHRHRQSPVSAFTLGYMREAIRARSGSIAVGADITGYAVPDNLQESYGSPLSFHVFLRFRATRSNGATPVEHHH